METTIAHNLETKERTTDVKLKDSTTFNNMVLSNCLKKGMHQAGYLCPTVIQATAIPVGKSGLDLLVQSKSGTGKTLIFCAIILEAYEHKVQEPQSLVIVPTRELAVQIETVLNLIGRYCSDFRAISVIGGVEVGDDRKRLVNARAIVGTPGRLLHLLQNEVLNTTKIKTFVLDEADKLYTQNFRKDVECIQKFLMKDKQTIACSATFCNGLDKEVAKIMRNPLLISTDNRATLLVGIKQFVYELPEKKTSIMEMQSKLDALRDIFSRISFQQCLIFAGSQSRANSYRNYLEKDGWPCDLISGAQDQQTRLEMFHKFRENKTRIMLATDLMARGVDSEYVNLVINLELPTNVVTYLHRIGRAGRFGSHGLAISFVSSQNDQKLYKRLISEIGDGMNVLNFPKKTDIDKYDIWNFTDFQLDIMQCGLYNVEPLAPLASYDILSLSDSQDDKKPNVDNCSVTQSSIDTKMFQENSKDSALNNLGLQINGLETSKYVVVVQDEQQQSSQLLNSGSQHSSTQMLPSSNTIDDASSIAADSIQSSQQDISRYHALMGNDAALKLYEYLIDPNAESSKHKSEQKPNNFRDLFEDYAEEVLNNECVTIKTNLEEAKPHMEISYLKTVLIDKPVNEKELENNNHLYSDYINFNEVEKLSSKTSNTISTNTTTEHIDKETFVLSIDTPTHAHDSLEELQNSSLNISQLDSVTDTISVPEKPHFTSLAHATPNNAGDNILSLSSKLAQQKLSVNVAQSINIVPVTQSEASQSTDISNRKSERTNSNSQTEHESSEFDKDANANEFPGIETTDLEEISNKTVLSDSSFADDSRELKNMFNEVCEETDDDEYDDYDSKSTDSNSSVNMSYNAEYQTAYDRWVHLYWNQLHYVQDYVKLVGFTQQQAQ